MDIRKFNARDTGILKCYWTSAEQNFREQIENACPEFQQLTIQVGKVEFVARMKIYTIHPNKWWQVTSKLYGILIIHRQYFTR